MRRTIFLVPVFLFLILWGTPADAESIFKIGRNIHITENTPVDNAVTVGGQITVSGLVDNHVVAFAGSVVLTGEAIVRGDVVCIGGVVVRGNGSQVYGNITEINSANVLAAVAAAFYDESQEWSWLTDLIYFCFLALMFILAALTAFLFPRALEAMMFCLAGHRAKSFFCGVLGILLLAPFFMLLVLSFIGIPLIPLALAIVLLIFVFGFIAVSALIGRRVLTKAFRHHKKSLIKEIMLGVVIWWMVSRVPFHIGTIVTSVWVTLGFGGVLFTLFGRGFDGPENKG